MQFLQQESLRQLLAEKRAHKEQSDMPQLLSALEQFSGRLKTASNNSCR
jgi:hypothetical protein